APAGRPPPRGPRGRRPAPAAGPGAGRPPTGTARRPRPPGAAGRGGPGSPRARPRGPAGPARPWQAAADDRRVRAPEGQPRNVPSAGGGRAPRHRVSRVWATPGRENARRRVFSDGRFSLASSGDLPGRLAGAFEAFPGGRTLVGYGPVGIGLAGVARDHR